MDKNDKTNELFGCLEAKGSGFRNCCSMGLLFLHLLGLRILNPNQNQEISAEVKWPEPRRGKQRFISGFEFCYKKQRLGQVYGHYIRVFDYTNSFGMGWLHQGLLALTCELLEAGYDRKISTQALKKVINVNPQLQALLLELVNLVKSGVDFSAAKEGSLGKADTLERCWTIPEVDRIGRRLANYYRIMAAKVDVFATKYCTLLTEELGARSRTFATKIHHSAGAPSRRKTIISIAIPILIFAYPLTSKELIINLSILSSYIPKGVHFLSLIEGVFGSAAISWQVAACDSKNLLAACLLHGWIDKFVEALDRQPASDWIIPFFS